MLTWQNSSVADSSHFGVDPAGSGSCYVRHWPSRRQQKTNLFGVFLFITFWRYIYIILQNKKDKRQNSRNQGFSYCFCLMIEGSGAGSIPLTNGSGSGGPKTNGSDGSGFGSVSATQHNSGVECSGRERSAGVGERGGAAAPAPQGQAHQAAEARDRVQEGQISGQSKGHLFHDLFGDLTSVVYVWIRREPIVVRQPAERLAT